MINKIIISAAAVAVAGTVAYTAANHTVSDAKDMLKAIHGQGKVTDDMDLTGDSEVDVFDLILMKQSLAQKGELTDSSVKATEENVRYIGRNYYDGETMWLVQSGSAAEFTVSGRSAEITIKGDSAINNDEKYRPRFAVFVDGELLTDEIMSVSSKKIKLFEGETDRTSVVKVIHLSEANNGTVGVSDISVYSDSSVPVAPTPAKDLKIEFIGDSITCGYGVEGASNYESFSTSTENFMKSYAYLTAEKLGADYSAVCYSGHGIISGYTSDGVKNTGSLVPPYYPNIGSFTEYAKPWDFSAAPNDVVVINLGTNDSSYIDKDFDERKGEFVEKYTDFLADVRKYNPDAHIICTLGIMGCTDEYPLIEEAVANFCKETGDKKVTCYMSPVQSASDGYGSDWHPSAVTQQKNAYILADKICQVLGIESDQIGLDVAADASYDLVINSADNANAAKYFSDYDKSLWINVVSGGDSIDDIEAVVSGIGIKKDGEYNITFKATAPEGAEIPVIIRGKDGTVYFSDTFVSKGEKTPYSAEFKSSVTDADAEFVMQAGGKAMEYKNLTIYELRIEKTK